MKKPSSLQSKPRITKILAFSKEWQSRTGHMIQMTETYRISFESKSSASDPRRDLLMHWTIGQVLRANPNNKFREQFLDNPYLDQIVLYELLCSPLLMANFLENCRKLPHCGETSIKRLREAIEMAADGKIPQSRGKQRR